MGVTRGPRGRLAMRRSPRPRRPVRRVLIGGAAVLVVAGVVVAVRVLRPAPGIAPPAPLMSDFERGSSADIVRDCGAPRGALVYRPRSGHGLEEVSVGPMAYLDP